MIQAVFLLGGKGSRLGLIDRPKPLVDVDGLPLLRRSLNLLAGQGVRRFVFLVNYMAEAIRDMFGDGGAEGWEIAYAYDNGGLGTAGAVRAARDLLEEEFLLVYGDVLFDVDIARFCRAARAAHGNGTLMIHPNDHPIDSDLVRIDQRDARTDAIVAIHQKPRSADALHRNLVNAGLCYLRRSALLDINDKAIEPDWGRDVFPTAVAQGAQYSAYRTIEYVKDIGTPERLERGRLDVALGIVDRRSYRSSQSAVFLDRDGVLNAEINGVYRSSDLVLLPGAAEGIRRLNLAGIATILITNQPGVAKGMMTMEELENTHARLDQLLSQEGAYLDDAYCCTHYPVAGFAGEVPELKVACACRKPSSGMFLRAAKDHVLALDRSVMIGDRDVDITAARTAGCATIYVPTNRMVCDSTLCAAADDVAQGLSEAVDIILSKMT
ncbi:HAD-IIIA family hydrolase [Sinorhizobium medicae]|nr:HAD-IIIA family hydrolase [Sinorhizobium medicae]